MNDSAHVDHDETPSASTLWAWVGRSEVFLVSGLLCLVFLASAHQSGIWEPYESNVASVAETMVEDHAWLAVDTSVHNAQKVSAAASLPFEYWPTALSISLFGLSELGLRLPMVLLMVFLLGGLMHTVKKYVNRTAAWFSVLVALSLPLFLFHGRFAFGHGTAITTSALAALVFITNGTKPCSWRYGGGWLLSAFAGLSGGLLAFAIPASVFACLWGYNARPRARHTWVSFAAPLGAVSLMAIGWWRAYTYSGIDSLDVWLLSLVQMSGLDGISAGDKRPFFNLFVHQIGFGLFPFGAILPIVFADLCWNEDETYPWLGPVLLVWCAMGFLGPAMGLMHTQYGILMSAPSAAMALGIYFHRLLSRPPQPALAFLSVVLIALLDSNLKHDTQLLADAIVGSKVDSFPAEFPNWPWARRLNALFLGLLLLYQGGIHRWGKTAVRFFLYPKNALQRLNRPILCVSALMPIVLVINFFFPKVPFLRFGFLAWEGSGSHLFVSPRTQVLAALTGVGLWIVSYWILWIALSLFHLIRRTKPRDHSQMNGVLLICALAPTFLITSWLRSALGLIWSTRESSWGTLIAVSIGIGCFVYGLLWSIHWGLSKLPVASLKSLGPPRIFRPKSLAMSALLAVCSLFQLGVMNRLAAPVMGLGNMKAFLGQIVLVTLGWVVLYWTLWLIYMTRWRWLNGAQSGKLSTWYDGAADILDGHLPSWLARRLPRQLSQTSTADGMVPVPLVLLVLSLSGWMVFMNGPVAAAMTNNMSSKAVVDTYQSLAQGDEQLYAFGTVGQSNAYYFGKLDNLDAPRLRDKIREGERFFAVVPRTELSNANLMYADVMAELRGPQATAQMSSPTDTAIPVLYDGGSRHYLVSNIIREGEENLSPIKKALPDDIPPEAKPLQVNFDDKIELVGWWVEPEFPKPGSPMTTHLIFRSLVDNPGNWKIFMHIDPVGAKQRIHGDHEPVQGVHPTKNWRKGQLIHDEYEIEVSRTHPIGDYKFHLGLYRGKPRLKINEKKTKQKHKENRVEIGTIRLK